MAKTMHHGTINQIISGDSVEIRGKPVNGPPPKIVVILSNIRSPKLGRRPSTNAPGTADEPFAWEARELLRTKCIGKEVVYQLEKEVRPGTSYGSVYLVNGNNKENLACMLLSSGYGVLRESKNPEVTGTEWYQTLLTAQNIAKENALGQWGEQAIQRRVVWDFEEVAEFASGCLGKPIKVIVEYVRDGSSMQVLMLQTTGTELVCYSSMVLLTGVKTPVKNDQKPEPYALQSHYFVESRMLQREVNLVIETINRNNLTGSLLHPNGNIAVFLLREGLARCIETGLCFLSPASSPNGADDYRAAESKAKAMRKNIWHDWQPPTNAASTAKPAEVKVAGSNIVVGKPFQATVIEVGNGDNITVRCPDGQLRKFFFANVKPPRLDDGARKQIEAANRVPRPMYDVPYAFEAREFLRKKLIGKKASITVEYIQPKQPNTTMDERYCVSVNCGGTNIVEGLVSKGLATVIRPRITPQQNATAESRIRQSAVTPQSQTSAGEPKKKTAVDILIAAEDAARGKSIGLHSGISDSGKIRINEVARNPQMAKQVLPSLVRAGRIPAIVEFITSPSRMRVFLTRDNMLITLLLEGIIVPQTSREKGKPDEPFSQEALEFVRENFMQHDVEVEIQNTDRMGNFIGWLYLPGKNASAGEGKKKKKQSSQQTVSTDLAAAGLASDNLAVCLVAKGYATRWSTSYSGPHAAELAKMEAKAKASKLGQWSSPEFVKQMEENENKDTIGKGDQNGEHVSIENEKNGSAGNDGFAGLNGLPAAARGGRWQKENLYMEELLGIDQSKLTDAKRKELTKAENDRKMSKRKHSEVTFIPGPTAGSLGLRFFVQLASSASELERISVELNQPSGEFMSSLSSSAQASYKPENKDMCAAKFSADDCWYRARVKRVDLKQNIACVLFIDFGNSENIPLDAKRLARLPNRLMKSPASLASEYRLAAVQLPNDPQSQIDAVLSFGKLLENKQLYIIPEHEPVACGKDDTAPVPSVSVMLFNPGEANTEPEKAVDAAKELLSDGRVYLEPFRPHIRRMPAIMIQGYNAAQNEAKEAHKNIWRFGDAREDLVDAN